MSITDRLSVFLPLSTTVSVDQGGFELLDYSGNDNSASVDGNLTTIPDSTFGSVISFDGSAAYATYTPWNDLNGAFAAGSEAFSVTGWFKPEATGSSKQPVFTIGPNLASEDDCALAIYVNTSGALQVDLQNGGTTVSATTESGSVGSGRWQFFCVTVQSDQLSLTLGSYRTTTALTYSGFSLPRDSTLSIGAEVGTVQYFEGAMANIRVYSRTLPEEDIDAIIDADLSNQLELHLPMNNLQGSTLTDTSGHSRNATVSGTTSTVSVITDNLFGSVLQFGDAGGATIDLSGPTYTGIGGIDAITLEMWVKTTGDGNMHLVDYSSAKYYGLSLGTVNGVSGTVCWTTTDRTGVTDTTYSDEPVNDGNWHFISVTYEAGTGQKTVYVDGVSQGEKVTHLGQPLGYGDTTVVSGTIGNTASNEEPFKGSMTQFFLHHRTLDTILIQQDMAEGVVATSSFSQYTPVGFELLNRATGDRDVIYIADQVSADVVELRVTNLADQALELAVGSTPLTAENCQFQLLFRPGTLSDASLAQLSLSNAESWNFLVGEPFADGSVPLYFSAKQAQVLYPNSVLTFGLQNLAAAPAGGTRSSRVQLTYQNLTYSGLTTPVVGQREVVVNIINQQGKQEIPLIASFAGTNEVIVDQANTIAFRITNGLSSNTDFNGQEANTITLSAGDETGTALLLSFEGWDANTQAKSDNGWDLNSYQVLKNITAGMISLDTNQSDNTTGWSVEQEMEGSMPYWKLTPSETIVLQPRESIVFRIQNVTPVSPVGQSQMFVDYQNIPGYWDGRFVLLLEKGLIQQSGDNLYMGNTDTGIRSENSNLYFFAGDESENVLSVRSGGAVEIGSSINSGYVDIYGGNVNLYANGNSFPGIVSYSSSKYFSSMQYHVESGSISGGNAKGGLNFYTYGINHDMNAPIKAMSVRDDGNVVINAEVSTQEPVEALTVEGGNLSLRTTSKVSSVKVMDGNTNAVVGAVGTFSENGTIKAGLSSNGDLQNSNSKIVVDDAAKLMTFRSNSGTLEVDGSNNGQVDYSVSHLKVSAMNSSTYQTQLGSLMFENRYNNRIIGEIRGYQGDSSNNSSNGTVKVLTEAGGALYESITAEGYGHVGVSGTPDSNAKLYVHGDIKCTGDLKPTTPPMNIQRYTGISGNDDHDTGVSVSGTTAIIAGFAISGDINESGSHSTLLKIVMKIKNSRWYIDANMANNGSEETWDVDVLFIQSNLASDDRF